MPYVVARSDKFKKEIENPYKSSGWKNQLNGGLDGKLGITNNLTMDFTINPDFGQVEADPSQVNLTSFETFYQEKRPFFIEGKNILSYGLMFGDGDLSSENMFYSRRIGRRPHNGNFDGDHINAPEFTSILGAAKITGKTKTGWSIGILESLTGKEFADITTNGAEHQEMVEPFTNYTIARLQKDFDKGNTMLGGMLTSVNRKLNDSQPDELQRLHKTAITGGLDFVHKWHNKDWEFALSNYFSRVEGSPKAITETQKSWIHGFQRPDATHLSLDTTRTSLMGQGGKISIGEYGGKFKFMFATAWKSPGLELNDVGFMRQADNILEVFWIGYRIYEPFSIFRNLNLNFNQWTEWNFARELTGPGGNINAHTQFTNYWRFDFGVNYNGEGLASTELRGGPALKVAGTKNIWFAIGSNEQKKLTAEYQMMALDANVKDSKTIYDFNLSLGYRRSKSLKITVTPSFNINNDELQFVDYPDYTDQATGNNITDYIFARIDQKTLSASLRINYNITPDLSIQYWGQPFVSSGKYSEFKRITDSRADEYSNRFGLLSDQELTFIPPTGQDSKGTYQVNDVTGSYLYEFEQPDFNTKEFLSNMVVRWEYLPGSTIYLVWSQTRHNDKYKGPFNLDRDMTALFNNYPKNVFLMKMSIRLGR